jgi:L-threonylcarbamoyladenylate synthase
MMKTRLLKEEDLSLAVSLLKEGEPVAIPTETVYGLAAPIFNLAAIEKIFLLKGRPRDNPLIAHVSSLAMVDQIAQNLPPVFHLLAKTFWPGPLTLVLPKKKSVSSTVSGGHNTIAVRMPSHELALRLIEEVGEPLVAPSANLSGRPSPTQASHVLEDFDGTLSAVLDGGPCQIGLESTVLNLTGSTPSILRPGSITREQIEAVLGITLSTSSGPVLSPGMKYRHYAPKAPIQIATHLDEVKGPFLLSREPSPNHLFRPLDGKNFYRHLREADALGVDRIFVLLDPVSKQNDALMNRLQKAAQL